MNRFGFIVLSIFVLFSFGCSDKDEYIDVRGADYAGAESCVQCHKNISHKAFQTAHYKATAPATPANVLGDFTTGRNAFLYDSNTKLVMEQRGDSLYQVLFKNGKEFKSYRFDIVFGSENAQTAVYFKNQATYEMPISYYKAVHGWATSPGFSAETPYFERKVVKDCYACHSSSASSKRFENSSEATHFMTKEVEDVIDKTTMIYGIDCERCHGPAKKHVDHHLKFPDLKAAHEMLSFDKLSNQQKMDACSICHSGSAGLKIKSRFEFKPGDNLLDYYRTPPTSNGDVHGNQAGLLSESSCFIKSKTMNCMTCHNPHENAKKDVAAYSKICISCHDAPKHKSVNSNVAMLKSFTNNCIDCHMPKEGSKAIKFQTSGSKIRQNYNLRTHKIAVYEKQ